MDRLFYIELKSGKNCNWNSGVTIVTKNIVSTVPDKKIQLCVSVDRHNKQEIQGIQQCYMQNCSYKIKTKTKLHCYYHFLTSCLQTFIAESNRLPDHIVVII